jgi:hypothetical protein
MIRFAEAKCISILIKQMEEQEKLSDRDNRTQTKIFP